MPHFSRVSLARLVTLAAIAGAMPAWADGPRNVIVFVGDGMGFEQVEGAGYYFNGAAGQFNFELFPYTTRMTHNNSLGAVTDSAASGTALSTGFKVNDGVISMANSTGLEPRRADNSGAPLQTTLQHFAAQGKATGLVTTSYMTDATPAAFGAHNVSRSNSAQIAAEYFGVSRPNVLFGGGAAGFDASAAATAGYAVATDRASMNALSNASPNAAGVFGSSEFAYAYDQSIGASTFYNTNPYLPEMTAKALSILGNAATNPNGFFLLVENELTDSSGHSSTTATKSQRNVHEVGQLRDSVQQVLNWINDPAFPNRAAETLVVVTADHETGRLNVTANPGQGNYYPSTSWGSTSHTESPVPVYAMGPNAERVVGTLDNTSIAAILKATTPGPAVALKRFREGENGYTGTQDTYVRGAAANDATLGAATTIFTDGDDGGQPTHAVVRFENVFGAGAGQVPLGATIISASLILTTGTAANNEASTSTSVFRMLSPWSESSTWTTLGAGISPDGTEAMATLEGILTPATPGALEIYDVTDSVQAWADGQANYGWALLPNGTNGWGFISSEGTLALRPQLEIVYVVPEPATLGVVALGAALLLRRRRGGGSGR